MPIIVIKFPIDRLHQGFKGPGPQINDERERPVFQRQVDVVGRFARVQHQSVPVLRLEGERDLVAAALYRVLRQVVAEVLRAFEGRHVFLFPWKEGHRQKERLELPVLALSVSQSHNKNEQKHRSSYLLLPRKRRQSNGGGCLKSIEML